MDYQPSYGFLKDCLYRSESYKVTLADAYSAPATRVFSSRYSYEFRFRNFFLVLKSVFEPNGDGRFWATS